VFAREEWQDFVNVTPVEASETVEHHETPPNPGDYRKPGIGVDRRLTRASNLRWSSSSSSNTPLAGITTHITGRPPATWTADYAPDGRSGAWDCYAVCLGSLSASELLNASDNHTE